MIIITAGDDRTLTITVNYSGAPLNLTGYTVDCWLKGATSGTVIQKTTGAGVALLPQSGATLGQATVAIDGADTSSVVARETFDVEVQVKSASGKRTSSRKFEIVVEEQIVTT